MGAICSTPERGQGPIIDIPDQNSTLNEEILKFESDLEKNELRGHQINKGLVSCQIFMAELVEEMHALLNDSITENDMDSTEKHKRYSGLLSKINQSINEVVSQQSDLKQLRSSLNEVKGLMGTDLQHLVTLEKIAIAQSQISNVASELDRLEADFKTEQQLCQNLRDATGDGLELVEQFKEILEALREDKAEIKNSFDRQGNSIQDLQSMLETMKSSPLFKEPDLFTQINIKIEEMKNLKMSKVQMVQEFIAQIDEKYSMKAYISVKGKADKSLAAEQLAEIQLLANKREQIKLEYSQLKEDLRQAKEDIIQQLKLPEILMKVEELSSSLYRPFSMKQPLDYASKNLGNALNDGKEARNLIEQINLAYYLSFPQKIKLIENERDQIINMIEISKGVINNKAEELEIDVPDDLVLREVKKNFQYFSDQFEKFKATLKQNVEGHPKSKEEIPEWIQRFDKLKGRLKVLKDLQNVFQGLIDTVLGIKKPELANHQPKKEEKKRKRTEEADFIPNTHIDSVIDELQKKIAAKLTLQLMDAEKSIYLFGTRKVVAKVINGKLMIRVGGGYMAFEEFYKTYAEAEKVKLLAIVSQKEETASTNTSPDAVKKKKKAVKKKKKTVKKIAVNLSAAAIPAIEHFDEGTTANFEECDDDDDEEDELNMTIPCQENGLLHNESARELL